MDIFTLFSNTSYTFLRIESTDEGNVVVEEYPANGVFKMRDGMVQIDNLEQHGGAALSVNASIHIKSDESFLSDIDNELVGNGVRVDGVDYRIEAAVEGRDYDTGELEFYRASLKRESIATDMVEALER